MTRELSNTIHTISLTDAVDKALPIIIQLGKDNDDSVREALAGELDKLVYFYYQVSKRKLLYFRFYSTNYYIEHTTIVIR